MTWAYGLVKEGNCYYLAEIYSEDGFANAHTDMSAFNIVGESPKEVQEIVETMNDDLKDPLVIKSFNDTGWEDKQC